MERSLCLAPRSSILMLGTSLTRTEESYKKVKYWKRKTQRNGVKINTILPKKAKLILYKFLLQYSLCSTPHVWHQTTSHIRGTCEQSRSCCSSHWGISRLPSWDTGKFNQSSERKSISDLKTHVLGPALILISFSGSSQTHFPVVSARRTVFLTPRVTYSW